MSVLVFVCEYARVSSDAGFMFLFAAFRVWM